MPKSKPVSETKGLATFFLKQLIPIMTNFHFMPYAGEKQPSAGSSSKDTVEKFIHRLIRKHEDGFECQVCGTIGFDLETLKSVPCTEPMKPKSDETVAYQRQQLEKLEQLKQLQTHLAKLENLQRIQLDKRRRLGSIPPKPPAKSSSLSQQPTKNHHDTTVYMHSVGYGINTEVP